MKEKKCTTISGTLLYPLLVGSRALIFHAGQIIRTSTIVAIHDANAEQIRFETRNTNYTLLMNPAPQMAACMAA